MRRAHFLFLRKHSDEPYRNMRRAVFSTNSAIIYAAIRVEPISPQHCSNTYGNTRRVRFRRSTPKQLLTKFSTQTVWPFVWNIAIIKQQPRNRHDSREYLLSMCTHFCEMTQAGAALLNAAYSTTKMVTCAILTQFLIRRHAANVSHILTKTSF